MTKNQAASKLLKTVVGTAALLAAGLGVANAVSECVIRTEIEVAAAPERVWRILTTTKEYDDWNPFMQSIDGDFVEQRQLRVVLRQPAMEFTPTILDVQENVRLEWIGTLGTEGIADGRHYFELTPTADGGTRLVHGEVFTGILVGALFPLVEEKTTAGFEAMNVALKERAELAHMAQRK